jgi:hypothetical protein
MEDKIKYLESKVKNCHNTNTIFDTRDYVLLDDVREILIKSDKPREEKLLQDYARYSFRVGIIDEDTMDHLIEDAQNYIY